LQVALERIGPEGRAVGVDLQPTVPLGAANATALVGDVTSATVRDDLLAALGGPADVVLCDVSPKLTGIHAVDVARRAETTAAVLDALPSLLRTGGTFLLKLFMDESHKPTVDRVRKAFREVIATRPDATRKGSAELYVIAKQYRPLPGDSAGR
jgi:23S rRNA (uridine2552-2'-O)-methyltransferase